MEIFELDQIEDGSVFHAGTSRVNEKIITSGGRVLNVVGIGDNLKDAILKAYELAEKISFEGKFFRKDIGKKGDTWTIRRRSYTCLLQGL